MDGAEHMLTASGSHPRLEGAVSPRAEPSLSLTPALQKTRISSSRLLLWQMSLCILCLFLQTLHIVHLFKANLPFSAYA